MQSGELDNCRNCGQLFLKDYTDFCLDCYQETEREFNCVAKFIKNPENLNATIEEIAEATGVSTAHIAEFIREGRIFADDYPNLGYPCSRCGKTIKRQVLCDSCFQQFSSEVNHALKRDEFMEQAEKAKQGQVREKRPKYWRVRQSK